MCCSSLVLFPFSCFFPVQPLSEVSANRTGRDMGSVDLTNTALIILCGTRPVRFGARLADCRYAQASTLFVPIAKLCIAGMSEQRRNFTRTCHAGRPRRDSSRPATIALRRIVPGSTPSGNFERASFAIYGLCLSGLFRQGTNNCDGTTSPPTLFVASQSAAE